MVKFEDKIFLYQALLKDLILNLLQKILVNALAKWMSNFTLIGTNHAATWTPDNLEFSSRALNRNITCLVPEIRPKTITRPRVCTEAEND